VFGRKGGVHGVSARDLGMSADEIAFFADLWRRCKAEGGAVTTEYGLAPKSGGGSWYLGTFTAFPAGPNGRPRMAFTAIDISERKRGEEQRRLLVNELNHRVKNTLAIVQSLVLQTMRGAASMNEARAAVSDRLVALAKAHDVLTRENWESADLRDLLDSVLAPHQGRGRFTIAGPAVRVNPSLALALALAIHELGTNAAKYGALSGEGGTVAITWEIAREADAPWLHLRWQEHDGPPVVMPTRKGFGSRLIEDSFSYSIGGSARIDYAADGVICIVRAPLAVKAA
jgi:two-component sensor histidine kinase